MSAAGMVAAYVATLAGVVGAAFGAGYLFGGWLDRRSARRLDETMKRQGWELRWERRGR